VKWIARVPNAPVVAESPVSTPETYSDVKFNVVTEKP
jgi:hypothetical protein